MEQCAGHGCRSRREQAVSVRQKIVTVAATLTLAGGLSTVGPPLAGAATAQCAPHCVQIFSAKFGTAADPRFVETVFLGIPAAGVPTGLQRVSSKHPAGDFIVPRAGLVSDFYATGSVSAAVNHHYGNLRAVQIEYAPGGEASGLCAGLATTAYEDEGLSLQLCSTPGTTVFIIDTADSPATAPTYFPIVSGSTTDFAHPFAMTIDPELACLPFLPITVRHLIGNPRHVPENQLWGANVLN
jgi:hypothetical protein